MSACEKCWTDAYTRAVANGTSQADEYRRLLAERTSHDHGDGRGD